MLVAMKKKYSTAEGKAAIESAIRGFVDDIVTADEVSQFIEEGIVEDWDDCDCVKDQARKCLAHRCSHRCLRRTGPMENQVVCRVPDARHISSDITRFFVHEMELNHSLPAVEIMRRLGLCEQRDDGRFIPCRDYLKSKRIYPPVRHGEGNISPVVGRIFAATRSTMNTQVCTSSGTTRHVVKCVAKTDENNCAVFHANQTEDKHH